MASRKQRAWNVPGFGLPLRWPEMQSRRWQPLVQSDENTLLGSALDGSENPQWCYTLRELAVVALINELTDQEGWHRIVFDNDAMFKWKSEKLLSGRDITRAMLDWSVEEAKYYSATSIKSGIIPAADNGVSKSDNLIPESLRTSIQQLADSLRADPTSSSSSAERQQNSPNQQTRNLLDPYLYPFIWERTKVIRRDWNPPITREDSISRMGEGFEVKQPPEGDCRQDDPAKYPNEMAWSRRFQWLSFDVLFDREGGGVRIPSYIPNLHPTKHAPFYPVIETLIDHLVPVFNAILPPIKFPGYINARHHLARLGRDPLIQLDFEPSFRPPEQRAFGEYLDAQGSFISEIDVDLQKELWNSGVQCILQMQEINFSPSAASSPSQAGEEERKKKASAEEEEEEYSIAGQSNERICATAAYIYSMHNISPSSTTYLSFRASVNPEEGLLAAGEIAPGFKPSVDEIYGAQHGDPALQVMGNVSLREGRVIAWPNTFQTRLSGLALQDETKEGWVRILKLHLLDPNRRNLSTSMVPVQRADWAEGDGGDGIGREEAERLREEFLEERREFERRHLKAMREYREWDFVLE